MLSEKCVYAYREQFNNNDCFMAEPSCNIMVENPETGKAYISPYNETDDMFMDRLERSKNEQHNLFFEEWDEYIPQNNVRY